MFKIIHSCKYDWKGNSYHLSILKSLFVCFYSENIFKFMLLFYQDTYSRILLDSESCDFQKTSQFCSFMDLVWFFWTNFCDNVLNKVCSGKWILVVHSRWSQLNFCMPLFLQAFLLIRALQLLHFVTFSFTKNWYIEN